MLLEVPVTRGGPVTHAFVVGVSNYPYVDGPEATDEGDEFGLTNLTGAARSASEIAAWLLREYRNPDAPLATVRILLSPAEGEQISSDVLAAMEGVAAPATRAQVEVEFNQFRTACRSDPGNVAFVYIAGHGIQLNKRGAVVLLEDFAVEDRNLLYGAIDVAGCRDAMDEAGNAHRQIWFSDACRQRPEVVKKFEVITGAFRPDEGGGQVEAAPLFLASSSRESAFSEVGGTTLFSQALLWALRGAGATGPDETCSEWHVPATRLIKLLPQRVLELLSAHGEEQQVDVVGRVLEVVTQRFDGPPVVDVEIAIRPEDATPVPVAELLFNAVDPLPIGSTWPLTFRGEAGIYQLKVKVAAPLTKDTTRLLNVTPPGYRATIEVL